MFWNTAIFTRFWSSMNGFWSSKFERLIWRSYDLDWRHSNIWLFSHEPWESWSTSWGINSPSEDCSSLRSDILFTMKLLASVLLVVSEVNAAWGPCQIGAGSAAQCQHLCNLSTYCEAWTFKESAKLGFKNSIDVLTFAVIFRLNWRLSMKPKV